MLMSVSVLQFNIFILPGMNTLIGYDLVPEPKILEAALRACRRLNDLASAIRILEVVKVREKTASVVLIIQRRLSTSIFAVVRVKCNNVFYHWLFLRTKPALIKTSIRT